MNWKIQLTWGVTAVGLEAAKIYNEKIVRDVFFVCGIAWVQPLWGHWRQGGEGEGEGGTTFTWMYWIDEILHYLIEWGKIFQKWGYIAYCICVAFPIRKSLFILSFFSLSPSLLVIWLFYRGEHPLPLLYLHQCILSYFISFLNNSHTSEMWV